MAGNNAHIVEVLCALWFDEKTNDWDSTYFGKFHEKIEPLGYTIKEEKKKVEITVELKANNPIPQVTEGQTQMIFRNPNLGTAIILSAGFISFHKLTPYKDFKQLLAEIITPILNIYYKIGQGNNLKEVQWLYLNKYSLSSDQKISSVLKFWPSIDDGVETNISFQTKYELDEGITAQLRLNGNRDSRGIRELFFECSTFVKSSKDNNDVVALANKAHESVNVIYDKLIRTDVNN